MSKYLIFILFLLCLTACDKKSENENPTSDASLTQSVENDELKISPTQSAENDVQQDNPTQSAENDVQQVNPTQSAGNDVQQVNPTQSAGNDVQQVNPTPSEEIEQTNNKEITTPVLVKGLFMGGLIKGIWMQRDEFFNLGTVNFDGFEYDVYYSDMNMGTAIGRRPTSWLTDEPILGDKYEEDFSTVDLFDKSNQPVIYDIAMKADWSLFPRSYTEKNAKQDIYDNLIKDYLKEYGIENPVTSIKQIISVDLEGDGAEEMLIAADNSIDGQYEPVKKGDNAILVFRKVVDGVVKDQIIEQDIRLEDDEYESLYKNFFRVETIADMDGDSIMEVIVKSWYYEGVGWSIYKLIDNRLELIASNGIGA